MNTDELDSADSAREKELIIWYYDRWLPVAAGKFWWRDEVKMNSLVTDTTDILGVQKVNVTVTSEAMGLLGWDNYCQKWLRQFQYKEKHGADAELPKSKTDEDLDGNKITHYAAKWSDSNAGQKKHGGWADEACAKFEECKNWVNDFRNNDANDDKAFQKYVLGLIKEKHKKKLEKSSGSAKKRRRRGSPEPPTAPPPPKVTRIDE